MAKPSKKKPVTKAKEYEVLPPEPPKLADLHKSVMRLLKVLGVSKNKLTFLSVTSGTDDIDWPKVAQITTAPEYYALAYFASQDFSKSERTL